MFAPDFSHHNEDVFEKYLEKSLNFENTIIFKATEGGTFVDDNLEMYVKKYLACQLSFSCNRPVSDIYIGLYHFCRYDLKHDMQTSRERAREEMENFFQAINQVSTLCGTYELNVYLVPILDYEGASLNMANRDDYLIECAYFIMEKCGTAPILYCSADTTSKYECRKLKEMFPDVGLWVAHYNVNKPDFKIWKNYTAWQFNSIPFDISIINDSFYDYYIRQLLRE